MSRTLKSGSLLGILFILPTVVVLGATIAYPVANIFVNSFRDIGTGLDAEAGTFVWLENYKNVLGSNSFVNSLRVSLEVVAISVILTMSLAMIMAKFLNGEFRGRGLARSLVILPWAMPTFVAAFIWRWMVDFNYGAINHILVAINLREIPVLFLGGNLAILTTSLIYTWKGLPLATIILLAGLQTVPQELRDAVKVDGASAWGEWVHVELPSLRFLIQITVSLLLIWNFNTFELMWLLTQGGPGDTTAVLPIHVYLQAFRAFNMGQASALGVIMLLFLLAITLMIFRFGTKDEV